MGANHLIGKGKQFEPGKSPNPGGRPNIAKILDGFGRKADDLRAKMLKQAVDIVEAGPKGTADATWRYTHDWLAAHIGLRVPKSLDVQFTDDTSDELDIDTLTADEMGALEVILKRRLGIDEPAADDTVQ